MKGVCLHIGLIETIYILLAVILQDLLNYCSSFFVTRDMGLLGRLELRNASGRQADCLLAVKVRDLLFLQRSWIVFLGHIDCRHKLRGLVDISVPNLGNQLVLLGLFELKKLLAHFLPLDQCICHDHLVAPGHCLSWTQGLPSCQSERSGLHDLLCLLVVD